jgi:hypothetical protein
LLRWILIATLLTVSAPIRAETNTATNAPSNPPIPENPFADADLFFAKYKEALKLVAQRKTQDAAIALDLLAKSLNTSPWMEIAILKHCQLIEPTNDKVAEEGYQLLRQRLLNAPYFQSNAGRAKAFDVALQGSVEAGITRLRIWRVRLGLSRYHAKYMEYPESLAKLAILGYTDIENIHAANDQPLRYTPQTPRMTPFISHQRYDLESLPPEPFAATVPQLEGTSRLNDSPPKYVALVKLPGRAEPTRIEENQTIQSFFVAAVAPGGAIVSTPSRVLVLPAP